MLVEMLPEQVANSWRLLEKVIKRALPPIADKSEEKMNNILTSLLLRKIICWASYQDPDNIEIDTIILTTVVMDEISGTRSLLIYCVNALRVVESDAYEGIVEKMTMYAKAMKCDKIVGYVADEKLVELAKDHGADGSYQLITFNIR